MRKVKQRMNEDLKRVQRPARLDSREKFAENKIRYRIVGFFVI